MDEPRLEELLYRIETLEREKRRWKVVGIGSLGLLLVIVLLGGLFTAGTVVMAQTARFRALQAEREAMQERDVAEQARQAAEARMQRARQDAEKKVQQDDK